MNSKLFVILVSAAALTAQDRPKRPTIEPYDAPAQPTTRKSVGVPGPFVSEKVGFQTPESVLHDTVADVYLVSNIHGAPTGVDNNGFITKLSIRGTVESLKWIEGGKDGVTLDAPKGMGIHKDVLFVADITNVRKFDRSTGKPLGSIAVPGATFLNDLVVADDGTVIVSDSGFKPDFSDSGSDALVAIKPDGKISVSKIPGRKPNGLARAADGLLCLVSWTGGEIFSDTGADAKPLVKLPKAQLDGLVLEKPNTWLVSSWEGKCVYRVVFPAGKGEATVTEVATKLEAPADIGWDAQRRCLLIPLFTENKVLIWPLVD